MGPFNFPERLEQTARNWRASSTNQPQQFVRISGVGISLHGSQLHSLACDRSGKTDWGDQEWLNAIFSPEVQRFLGQFNHFWAATVILEVAQCVDFRSDCGLDASLTVQMYHVHAALSHLHTYLPAAILHAVPRHQGEIDKLSKLDACVLLSHGIILFSADGQGFSPNPAFIDAGRHGSRP